MFYKPHTITYRRPQLTRDEYGRPVSSEGEWLDGGGCRCDDNSTQDLISDNGTVYRSTYKIVIEGKTEIQAGDEVIAYDKEKVRGRGKVNRVIRTNKLNYSVIWV